MPGGHWFKATDWLQGQGCAKWELAMQGIQIKWNTSSNSAYQGKTGVKLSQEVMSAISDSLGSISAQHGYQCTYHSVHTMSRLQPTFSGCHMVSQQRSMSILKLSWWIGLK